METEYKGLNSIFSISIQILYVTDQLCTCVLYDREVLMVGTADWRNLMRSMALLTILMTTREYSDKFILIKFVKT